MDEHPEDEDDPAAVNWLQQAVHEILDADTLTLAEEPDASSDTDESSDTDPLASLL